MRCGGNDIERAMTRALLLILLLAGCGAADEPGAAANGAAEIGRAHV